MFLPSTGPKCLIFLTFDKVVIVYLINRKSLAELNRCCLLSLYSEYLDDVLDTTYVPSHDVITRLLLLNTDKLSNPAYVSGVKLLY